MFCCLLCFHFARIGDRHDTPQGYKKMLDVMFDVVLAKKEHDLNSINPATHKKPFVSATADKATIHSKCLEIQKDKFINPWTGIANETTHSLTQLKYQEIYDFENEVKGEGTGIGRATKIIQNFGKIGLTTAGLRGRLSNTAFDGQYNAPRSLHVDTHLKTALNLSESQESLWDSPHRQGRTVEQIKNTDDSGNYANVS